MKLNMSTLSLAYIALISPVVAFAALGSDVSSVQTDRMQMKATAPVASKASNYTVHEMTTAAGVTVREYASSTGTVFALAWKGPIIPDLRQLMGPYFTTYTSAQKAKHGGHTHLSLEQEGLIVRARGHMRAYSGIAYLPAALPPGITEKDIK